MRDHLDIDPRLVHLLEAQLTEVIQPTTDFRRSTFWSIEGRRQFGVVIVLFQCDDERLPLRCHVCSSMERNVTLLLAFGCCLCIMCNTCLAMMIHRRLMLPLAGLSSLMRKVLREMALG